MQRLHCEDHQTSGDMEESGQASEEGRTQRRTGFKIQGETSSLQEIFSTTFCELTDHIPLGLPFVVFLFFFLSPLFEFRLVLPEDG